MDAAPAQDASATPNVVGQAPAGAGALPSNGIAQAAPPGVPIAPPTTTATAPTPTPPLSFSIPTTAFSSAPPMAAIQTMASLGLMPNGMPQAPLVPVKRKPGRPRKHPLPVNPMMAMAAMNPMMALAPNGVMPQVPLVTQPPRPQPPKVRKKPGRKPKIVVPPPLTNPDGSVEENGTGEAGQAPAKRGSGRAKKVITYADDNDGSEEEEQLMEMEKKKRARQLDSDIRVDVGYPLLEQIVGRRMNPRTGATEYMCKFLGRSYLHLYWLTFDELELFIPEGYSKYHRVQQYERKLRREGYQDLDDVDDVEANKVTIEKILSHKVDPMGHLDEQIEKRRKEVAVPKRYPRVTDRFLLDNTDVLQERLTGIVRKLLNENGGEIFAQPVNVDDIPEYLNIIANPMDLGSIATRLGRESYYVGPSATSLFAADVRLVFTNCKTFNQAVGHSIHS